MSSSKNSNIEALLQALKESQAKIEKKMDRIEKRLEKIEENQKKKPKQKLPGDFKKFCNEEFSNGTVIYLCDVKSNWKNLVEKFSSEDFREAYEENETIYAKLIADYFKRLRHKRNNSTREILSRLEFQTENMTFEEKKMAMRSCIDDLHYPFEHKVLAYCLIDSILNNEKNLDTNAEIHFINMKEKLKSTPKHVPKESEKLKTTPKHVSTEDYMEESEEEEEEEEALSTLKPGAIVLFSYENADVAHIGQVTKKDGRKLFLKTYKEEYFNKKRIFGTLDEEEMDLLPRDILLTGIELHKGLLKPELDKKINSLLEKKGLSLE